MEILIVDNSKLYAQILESSLDPESNTIHYYKSPNDALASASNIHYDYICASYALEQMDGIAFADELRLLPNYIHFFSRR